MFFRRLPFMDLMKAIFPLYLPDWLFSAKWMLFNEAISQYVSALYRFLFCNGSDYLTLLFEEEEQNHDGRIANIRYPCILSMCMWYVPNSRTLSRPKIENLFVSSKRFYKKYHKYSTGLVVWTTNGINCRLKQLKCHPNRYHSGMLPSETKCVQQ